MKDRTSSHVRSASQQIPYPQAPFPEKGNLGRSTPWYGKKTEAKGCFAVPTLAMTAEKLVGKD